MYLSLLPRELINYISLFVFTKCEICFKEIVYWNQYSTLKIFTKLK